MEKRYIRKDRTISWGRLNRSSARDHEDQPKYFIAVVEDITERIRQLATQDWSDMNAYAQAKTDVIEDVIAASQAAGEISH
jgi:hypothetical protein